MKAHTTIEQGVVARYCKPSHVDEGKPTADAFVKRLGETYLSVYLLDFFTEALDEQTQIESVKIYMERRNNWRFSRNALFSTLNVEVVLSRITQTNGVPKPIHAQIDVREEGLPHCGIYHNHSDDMLIAEYLTECVESVYLIKEIA